MTIYILLSQFKTSLVAQTVKASAYNAGDPGSIPGLGRSPGEENGELKIWLKTQHSKNEDHGIWSHYFMAYRWGNNGETVKDFIFLGSKITVDGDCSHEIKTLVPWKKSYDQPRQHIKKQRHYFAYKGQSYGFIVVIYG